ncbi:hypothetical protein FBU30_000646 [Linnemannia zychae]|nr:hypothetical protein FBU30_000646 [Linnemannia zychae]
MADPNPSTAKVTSTDEAVVVQSLSSSSSSLTLAEETTSITHTSSTTSISTNSSHRSNKHQREDDRSSWINGKRPKGYRTPEGKEAAEKCKNYKAGVSIPFLTHSCKTYEGVLKHAILGAIRSGGVSYGAKALVNMCLGMLKLMKGKGSFGRVVLDAFTGADAVRFGSFFGMFSFLWKLVNNGLKLYRGTDDRINGAMAGAIAGLALLIETPERRVTFAQQMFLRAMQGVYNAGKYRGQFSFRHGDALLFAVGTAQVLYAYTMHPDTIPKEFFGFMVKTARVPAEALALNRMRVRGFPLDLKVVRAMVDRFKPTAQTLETIANMSETVEALPCAALHPWVDSCRETNIDRFLGVTKVIFPVYATLNFVPLVVLRMKRLLKDPANVLSKTTFNALRSSVFLGVLVSLYQVQICSHRNLLKAGWGVGNSKYLYWLFGLTCGGAAIMCEQESRRTELAFYVLPKAVNSLYMILYRKNWVKGVKHWEVMLFSFAMALVMPFYQREEQVLSSFVTRMMYHVLGKN